jgi:hypothetical protein
MTGKSSVLAFAEGHIWWPVRRWCECRLKRCDYYQSYQALGPPELTHIGYHAAERMALEHRGTCVTREERRCETCEGWAERLRGEVWRAIMGNKCVTGDQLTEEKNRVYGFHSGRGLSS